ncbi:hypothetical protein [uncultured Roseovarius sp.]|uniref:hypothetical protein n=1 Tax=uncultured Roseovarius sp. TaxID=293344 RepID=UPI0026334DFB|nr:hypothetical protein [uncultured Roseovarius sp.]
MSIDDRDYMQHRYRARGGARNAPVWKDGPARLEYDEYETDGTGYPQRNPISRLFNRQGGRPGKNMLAAAVLGVAALVYTIWAEPFGEILDFSGLPKTGEFRVIQKLSPHPTGTLAFTAAERPVALHLIDGDDKAVYVGFVRANETAELIVPVGRWHTVVTEGSETSLVGLPEMRSGTPLGIIEIKEGELIAAKPSASEDAP